MDDPVNNTPKPRERSSDGSTRTTACAAPGKRPLGEPERDAQREEHSEARSQRVQRRHGRPREDGLHQPSARADPVDHQPDSGVPSRYAMENAAASHPYADSEMPITRVTVGASTASAVRSM